jgi:hypothetical protein
VPFASLKSLVIIMHSPSKYLFISDIDFLATPKFDCHSLCVTLLYLLGIRILPVRNEFDAYVPESLVQTEIVEMIKRADNLIQNFLLDLLLM